MIADLYILAMRAHISGVTRDKLNKQRILNAFIFDGLRNKYHKEYPKNLKPLFEESGLDVSGNH